ncbi:unnamed protein product [Paramecium sonneborni]|uniref:Protein kinase domain-containing protein n=1 Tax=Paramecium sonneborni TaxID=65129 RepID=A0A8S1Q9M7_9CILI|nr:unnamed protein product [Paramecium sonneborni]
MELADGDFYQFMQTQDYRRLSNDQKNQYFIQMVKGVDQLHDLGLFHSDLKPEKFVYFNQPNNQKIIKLIDLGLIKETSNQMAKTAYVGTPYYIAPEVLEIFNSQVFYDKSVDIWSLAMIKIFQWQLLIRNIQLNLKLQLTKYRLKNTKQHINITKRKRINLKDAQKIFNVKDIIEKHNYSIQLRTTCLTKILNVIDSQLIKLDSNPKLKKIILNFN